MKDREKPFDYNNATIIGNDFAELVSENLEQDAQKIFPRKKKLNKKGTGEYDINLPRRKAYIQGVKDCKQQIVARICEYSLYADGDFVTIDHDFSEDGYKKEDKIKIIILK